MVAICTFMYVSIYEREKLMSELSIYLSINLYLNAHAEGYGHGGEDEEEGEPGQQQGTASRAFRVG